MLKILINPIRVVLPAELEGVFEVRRSFQHDFFLEGLFQILVLRRSPPFFRQTFVLKTHARVW